MSAKWKCVVTGPFSLEHCTYEHRRLLRRKNDTCRLLSVNGISWENIPIISGSVSEKGLGRAGTAESFNLWVRPDVTEEDFEWEYVNG